MELKGSRTEKNLQDAFAGESQARNKYTYYASQAKKDGYEQIAAIFLETADNEKEHAKLWLKHLNGIKDTAANLESAAGGELYEHSQMYPEFARIADEEGFANIAEQFRRVAVVEAEHEARYLALLSNVRENHVFDKGEDGTKWRCRNCGHIHTGPEAPKVCPACFHPQAHFEVAAFNY